MTLQKQPVHSWDVMLAGTYLAVSGRQAHMASSLWVPMALTELCGAVEALWFSEEESEDGRSHKRTDHSGGYFIPC